MKKTSRNYSDVNPDLIEIGNRISTIRKAKKLTQAALAEKMGDISVKKISRLERGDTTYISPTFLVEVSTALNVSLNYLLTGKQFISGSALPRDFANVLADRTPQEKEYGLRLLSLYFESLDNLKK